MLDSTFAQTSRLAGLRVLAVGEFREPELAPCLRSLTATTTVQHAPDLAAALEHLQQPPEPFDLLLIAQSRPGLHSYTTLQAIQQRVPLLPVMVLLGSWCEGERRTGTPLPGTLRVYWYEWDNVVHEILPLLATGHRPATLSLSLDTPPKRTSVAILAADHESGGFLADALHAEGFTTVTLTPGRMAEIRGVSVLVCDLRHGADDLHLLKQLSARHPDAKLLALCGFLRWQQHEQLLAAGAARVLSKPLSVESLVATVTELAAEPSIAPHTARTAGEPGHLPFPRIDAQPAAARIRRA